MHPPPPAPSGDASRTLRRPAKVRSVQDEAVREILKNAPVRDPDTVGGALKGSNGTDSFGIYRTPSHVIPLTDAQTDKAFKAMLVHDRNRSGLDSWVQRPRDHGPILRKAKTTVSVREIRNRGSRRSGGIIPQTDAAVVKLHSFP